MQVRGLLVAIVALGLLAGGVYWSERNKAAEDAKAASGGDTKLVQVASDDVRRLEIQRREAAPVVLERDASKQWQMRAPETWRVDQDAATEIAGSYAGLSYDRVVDEKPSDLASYGLTAPAVTLSATAKDGKTGQLLIGDESPTGTGVFAKLANDPRVVLLPTSVKTTIDKSAVDVRDKRLLVFDPAKLTRVELTTKGGPVEFGRNAQKEWQIVRPKPQRADNGRVEELVQKLGDARMDVSAPTEEAAKFASGFAFGTRVAVASVSEGPRVQTLEVRKRGEDYFAKSSTADGVFKIAKETGEALTKSVEDFENKKLFDFGFNDPFTITVQDGDKSYAFRKSGENWTNNAGRQMDATSVQNLIDKVRDLAATRILPDAGGVLSRQTLKISVTAGDNKRVETVAIENAFNRWRAVREGEPAIYELDAKAVEELQRAAADVKEPPPPAKK